MTPFPSLEWMQAYADAVAAHAHADTLAGALAGRYRFMIDPGGGLISAEAYDLVVSAPAAFAAEVATRESATLTVRADYPRWRGLLTGKSDFVMSYLLGRITVEGDVGSIRSKLRDAKPLLQSLQQVPTEFRY